MTLYNLLQEYTSYNPLSQKAKEQLGMKIYDYWTAQGNEKVGKIMQTEPHATFPVNDYPDSFIPDMRVLINEFYQHITEKPASSGPKKRVRKHKPFFSGRQLKK